MGNRGYIPSIDTRESRYVTVARIAYHLAQEVLPRYSHPKSPHRYTLPPLAACVLLTFYLRLSYRDMEEWLLATDKVGDVLELKRVPDPSTLSRASKRLLGMKVLDQMRRKLLDEAGIEEEAIASDSTGYATTQASAYYRSRTGRTMREFRKGPTRWARAGLAMPSARAWWFSRTASRLSRDWSTISIASFVNRPIYLCN
nr:hypothetical protein [Chloroflexota bacterium]